MSRRSAGRRLGPVGAGGGAPCVTPAAEAALDAWLAADRARRPLAEGEHEIVGERAPAWGSAGPTYWREVVTVERRGRCWAVRVVDAVASRGQPPHAVGSEESRMRGYHRAREWAELVERIARGDR